MFAFGGPKRPQAVAFDVIGTMFPLEPLRAGIVQLGQPSSGLEGWFAAGCRDAFALAAAGDFAPFTQVLEAALEQVLAEQKLDASAAERKALVKQLETIDVRSDAKSALEALASADIEVVALSNGSKSSTTSLLERAGLHDLVQHVVSVEEVKLAKPRAEVYLHAAKRAGTDPGRPALVAVHPWDINGAAAAGLTTAYLSAERPYPSIMRKPDIQGRTLVELAQALADL